MDNVAVVWGSNEWSHEIRDPLDEQNTIFDNEKAITAPRSQA
jgi:hypothetical protein